MYTIFNQWSIDQRRHITPPSERVCSWNISIRPVDVSSWPSSPHCGWWSWYSWWRRQESIIANCNTYRNWIFDVRWFQTIQWYYLLLAMDIERNVSAPLLMTLWGLWYGRSKDRHTASCHTKTWVLRERSLLTKGLCFMWWWVGVACSFVIVSFSLVM